jgi:hypothetical protein
VSIRQNFLFVVFRDPVVVGAIQFLSSTLGAPVASLPHLTIQGPFEEKVGMSRVASIKKKLRDDIFFIGNPGSFKTKNGSVLFLRVSSDNLKHVWDKPDYPIEKFGFNPHVTLYEGPDDLRVDRALAFLKRYHLELLCRDFDVVQYVPKQSDFFPDLGAQPDEHAISKLISRGRLSSSFRSSFMAAVNRPEQDQSSPSL